MDLVVGGRWANPRRAAQQSLDRASKAQQAQMGQPLRISVPTQGILFAFEKLYANQSPEAAAFTIRYASAGADQLALLASLVGTILLWIGIVAIGSRRLRLSRNATVATLVLGIAVLVASIGYLGTTPIPASSLALAIALGLLVWWSGGRLNLWRQNRAAAAAEAPVEEA
jgi:glycerol uptake facilitator-like aquaporin